MWISKDKSLLIVVLQLVAQLILHDYCIAIRMVFSPGNPRQFASWGEVQAAIASWRWAIVGQGHCPNITCFERQLFPKYLMPFMLANGVLGSYVLSQPCPIGGYFSSSSYFSTSSFFSTSTIKFPWIGCDGNIVAEGILFTTSCCCSAYIWLLICSRTKRMNSRLATLEQQVEATYCLWEHWDGSNSLISPQIYLCKF